MAVQPGLITLEQLAFWREHLPKGHIARADQFDDIELLRIVFQVANYCRRKINTPGWKPLDGRVIFEMFGEPSTRTYTSFYVAAKKLGADVIGSQNAKQMSSRKKGESIQDTVKTLERLLCDAIIMRDGDNESAEKACSVATKPFLNGGSGEKHHPTQGLLDLYTIWHELGGVENKTYLFVGDLRFGRTVQSLVQLLSPFQNIKMIFASPEFLRIPDELRQMLVAKGIEFEETTDLRGAIARCDVFYDTRVQTERFKDLEKEGVTKQMLDEAYKAFRMPLETFEIGPEGMIGMHPLPRVSVILDENEVEREVVGELPVELDDNPGAKWWNQVENGVYIRMALLFLVLIKHFELEQLIEIEERLAA